MSSKLFQNKQKETIVSNFNYSLMLGELQNDK